MSSQTNIDSIKDAILSKYPSATFKITKGPDSGLVIERSILETSILGFSIKFHIGENLVFYIDNVPQGILRNLPLLDSKIVLKAVRNWIDTLSTYISKSVSLTQIKSLARKYLKTEMKIEDKNNTITLYYDLFLIIITAKLGLMALNSSKRVTHSKAFERPEDIEDFFKSASFFAEDIRNGKIK